MYRGPWVHKDRDMGRNTDSVVRKLVCIVGMIRRVTIAGACALLIVIVLWVARSSFAVQAETGSANSLGVTTIVSPAGNGEDISQIWAAADPEDGQHLIACGGNSFSRQNVTNGYVYSSADDGATWRRKVLDNATRFISEESCTYAAGGRAYFAAGESDTSTGEPRHEWGHLNLFVSDDHGMTWRRLWKRKDGWIDWTYLAAVPASQGSPPVLVVFGNMATDRLGHWWNKRPVALESQNGGQSFSSPVASRLQYWGTFAGGSVVLPDRTALFISDAEKMGASEHWTKEHFFTIVFAYTAGSHRLQPRAIIRDSYGSTISTGPSLVRDTSTGRFHGRLYTAWSESGTQTGQLWLATSDDNGYHWSSRPILSGLSWHAPPTACQQLTPTDVKLGIDRAGALGILWEINENQVMFASSNDGGQTFSSGKIVARHDASPVTAYDAVIFNEYWLAEVVAINAGRPGEPYVDVSHLGLSVRMTQSTGISDFALVADARNVFHAIWGEVRADGTHGMLTRTIRLSENGRGTNSKLMDAPTSHCTQSVSVHPPLPGAAPRLVLAGQRDVTKSLFLRLNNVNYDAPSQVVSVDLILVNRGKTLLGKSLSIFGLGLHSDYGDPVALNATGVVQGQPFWDASSVIPSEGLKPTAGSKPLRVKFKLAHFHQLPGSYATFGGDGVAMLIRIYQKTIRFR